MTPFKERVCKIVKTIPYGKIASYGQIALMAGIPRAARQVGWVLNQLGSDEIPWWRIINNKGYISIKNNEYSALEQKTKLEAEGIVLGKNLTVDISKYRYTPTSKAIKKLELDQESLEKLFKII